MSQDAARKAREAFDNSLEMSTIIQLQRWAEHIAKHPVQPGQLEEQFLEGEWVVLAQVFKRLKGGNNAN